MTNTTPIERHFVPLGGDFQTVATVQTMKRIVNDALRDPIILQTAVDAVRDVNGRDPRALARRLFHWLEAHVEFLPDPNINGEVLRTPRFLIDEIRRTGTARGDCDDGAMLSAALAKSVGLAARIVCFAFFGPRDSFRHVFTQVEIAPNEWVSMDFTEPAARRAQLAPSRALIAAV